QTAQDLYGIKFPALSYTLCLHMLTRQKPSVHKQSVSQFAIVHLSFRSGKALRSTALYVIINIRD
ncbi:MAG: hypothetical protein LBI75_11400, partial [Brucellaceae bacterium]|nr:hypothetical protein [Brucellaceae bacterium]